MKNYTKYNFHKYTFCVFNEVASSEIELLQTHFISKSGSSYVFTAAGVYRTSDHWGRAANCKWRLQSISSSTSRTKIGFAKWNAFHAINESEKLYFIEVNLEEKTVQYQHINNSKTENVYLRTATETTKKVKEIRALLENNKKLDYWETDFGFDKLLEKVVAYQVSTDLSLLEIKNLICSETE